MTPVPTHLPAAAVMPAPLAPATAFLDPNPARRVVVDVERPGDAEARESLLDRAFGPGRFAKTCERLRARRLAAHGLSLVARPVQVGGGAEVGRDGIVGQPIAGTVRLWHVAAGERQSVKGDRPAPALMLGPLAVEDAWRCHRVGGALMTEAIRRARLAGHGAILLVGDEPYYRRFGFVRAPAALRMPGPVDVERFLMLELLPGALAGARGTVRATGAFDLAGHRAGRRLRRGPGARRRAA